MPASTERAMRARRVVFMGYLPLSLKRLVGVAKRSCARSDDVVLKAVGAHLRKWQGLAAPFREFPVIAAAGQRKLTCHRRCRRRPLPARMARESAERGKHAFPCRSPAPGRVEKGRARSSP